MIKHAMTYVQLADNVCREGVINPPTQFALGVAQRRLAQAESQLVKAFSEWRKHMKSAAAEGSELATRYVEESTWDLT